MIPYYLLFTFTFLASCVDICNKKQLPNIRKELYLLLSFLTFFCFYLFTGCKGNVGTDYLGYYNIYTYLGKLKYSAAKMYVEPVFWIICRIFNLFNFPFSIFWFFIAAITLSTKFIFIKKLSPYFFLSILIYLSGLFIERDFDGIRQGLSIGVAYIAILQYLKDKKIRFAFLLLIAIGIHYSSLVFILVPILANLKLNKKLILFLVIFGFILIVIRVDIVNVIIRFIPNGYIRYRIEMYLNEEYGSAIGINIGIIVRIIVLFLFVNIKPNAIGVNIKTYNLLLNGFLLSIIFFCFFNNMEIIAHRFAYGFREFQIILIPICFKYYIMEKNILKDFKVIAFQIYVLYAFLLFYRVFNSTKLRPYYEYSFIFNTNPF